VFLEEEEELALSFVEGKQMPTGSKSKGQPSGSFMNSSTPFNASQPFSAVAGL
jgi:hypothetical protein